MSTGTTVPLEEYLAHTYHPDCEYVDGQIVERNVGEYFHSLFQATFVFYLLSKPQSSSYRVLTECRARVRGGSDERRRYRIPDVSIVPVHSSPTSIILEPPLAVVEILSPDDRFIEVVRKCADYEAFGIPEIWLVDPHSRGVWSVRDGSASRVEDLITYFASESGQVQVDFNDVFANPNLN